MRISNLIKWLGIVFLPIVFVFIIFGLIKDITKSENDFKLNKGIISEIGITERISKGTSHRSIITKTDVFYVKIKNDNNKYSYFEIFSNNYQSIIHDLKIGDFVKIYNEGIDKNQNTISIIQLEKGNQILISKSIHNKRNYFIIIAFLAFLILYVIIIYRKFKNHDKTSYYK
ncbi:MAG: hypothetical protein ACRC8Z_06745 [Empedobacter falsenii]|uniref:hypothetical protein n=2 Tax=Empedobacter sp. TaxID=1927715 RepID=UPI0028B1795A|nr:hypothetical protein [Empedobacter sp.]